MLAPAGLFLCAFFLAPLAWSILVSLRGSAGPAGNYVKILTDAYYLQVLRNTLLLGAGVTLLCALLGYPCAYLIARGNARFARWMVFAVCAPLLVSIVIRSFGWVVLLGRQGLLNSTLAWLGYSEPLELLNAWPGVTIALVHVLLPYMVLSIASVLVAIPGDLEEAAQTLGASPARTFWRVTFPLSLDGVGTGSILVFMLAIGSFVTVLLVGGERTMILPLLMYQQVTVVGNFSFAAALGNILLVAALIVLYVQAKALHRRGRA